MLTNKGSEWKLQLSEHADETLLMPIPGLRMNNRIAVGLIDAISAACEVLRIEKPQRATPTPFLSPLLFPFQQDGVGRLLEITSRSGGALLADDVGLGKTRQALVYSKERNGRTLIICPAYVRRSWEEEIKKLFPQDDVCVVEPLNSKNKKLVFETLRHGSQFTISSYEMADTALRECFQRIYPTTLILDEAHYLCGRQSKRSKSIAEIAALVPYKLALTATPAWNRPRDFFSLLKVLFGPRFGYPSSFDFRYCAGTINEFGGMVNRGVSNAEELRLRLSYYMVRREKHEVLKELPPLTRQVTWVDGTKKATDEFLRLQGLNALDTPNVSKALEATHEGKLTTAVELAIQAKRFLLFTYRKDHARKLHQLIEAEGVPCVCITGDLPTDVRAALCADAAREGKGVVATIDSAGAGLNLQGVAHYGIMHAIDWLPNKMHQAEGRLHRIGQTNGVLWNYIAMRDSIDEVVVRTVVEKMDSMHAILGGNEQMRNDVSDSLVSSPEIEADLLRQMYEDL